MIVIFLVLMIVIYNYVIGFVIGFAFFQIFDLYIVVSVASNELGRVASWLCSFSMPF